MAYELTHDAYGKSQNRLMRVVRDTPRWAATSARVGALPGVI